MQCEDAVGMALWGDHMALSQYQLTSVVDITVFNLAGVQLHTFGTAGNGPGQFEFPTQLCAHPNGNLLVLEEGNGRVQEVTWTGKHVRFICGAGMNGWTPCGIAVSPDSLFFAVIARHAKCHTLDVLDERTAAPVRRLGICEWGFSVQYSLDGHRVFIGGVNECKAMMFNVHDDHASVSVQKSDSSSDSGSDSDSGSEDPRAYVEFGANTQRLQRVEFTDSGDVVICDRQGGSVYCVGTLELVHAWTWPCVVRNVEAIQAHRGLLYVLSTGEGGEVELRVFE